MAGPDWSRHVWRNIAIAIAAVTLAIAGLGLVLFSGSGLLTSADGGASARRLSRRAGSDLIHVCLCSDETDLRGVAVAIKSTYANAASPGRLRFHVITATQFAPTFTELLGQQLPDIPVEVHHNERVQARILAVLDHRASSRVRKRDASPFNLAPFYLKYFLRESESGPVRRAIVMQADTVVLGDIGEAYDVNLGGHAVAAVKRCAEAWEDYIKFDEMRALGYDGFDPRSCAMSDALLVMDLSKWKRQDLLHKVEEWMQAHRGVPEGLYVNSVLLPPLMLAIGSSYLDLGKDWACGGAGEAEMSAAESQALRRSGFDRKAFRELGLKHSLTGSVQPYLATCTASAKLLHYGGTSKPWLLERLDRPSPVCTLPVLMPLSKSWEWRKDVKVFCEPATFVHCAEIWSHFISEEAACALKDFDKEWESDEDNFVSQQMEEEWRVARQRREKEKSKGKAAEEDPTARARREQAAEERRRQEERERHEMEQQARAERAKIEADVQKDPLALPLDEDDDLDGR